MSSHMHGPLQADRVLSPVSNDLLLRLIMNELNDMCVKGCKEIAKKLTFFLTDGLRW